MEHTRYWAHDRKQHMQGIRVKPKGAKETGERVTTQSDSVELLRVAVQSCSTEVHNGMPSFVFLNLLFAVRAHSETNFGINVL